MTGVGFTLGDLVGDNAQRFPDGIAYQAGHRTLTHARLFERAVRLASAMSGAGLRSQDRVVLLARNGIEFGEVVAAGNLSGIVVATSTGAGRKPK